VQTSGKHLLALINDLLDLAKIEAGKFDLNVELVDCESLLEEVVSSLRLQAQAKGLQLDITLPERPLLFRTDRRALNQIVINLVNNAIKFTNQGRVHVMAIETQRNGSRCLSISVADTGVGIRAEDQPKLFAAFARLNVPGHKYQEGTGLGLHLSQRLATLLGTEISLRSAVGIGSTFSLLLTEAVS